MRDRLEEFYRNSREKHSHSDNLASTIQVENLDASSLFVKEFLIGVEEIYQMFLKTTQKIQEVTEIQSAMLEFSESDERLYTFYDQIKNSFYIISEKITDLDKRVDVNKFYGSETELRICMSLILTLKRRLTSEVSDYYSIQEAYKEKCRARVERQAQISGADISTVEFEGAIHCGTDMFMQTVFPDYNVAHHYFQEIQQRHGELLRLESSLKELRDLIFDLNLILKVDYALLNRIDKNTRVVNFLAFEGSSSVQQYKRARKTHHYKYYVTFCCCATIIAIIVLAMFSTFA